MKISKFSSLEKLLGQPLEVLEEITNDTSKFYRSWDRKKPSGGYRKITEPKPLLKKIQLQILNKILSKCEPHTCCHGATKGKSPKTNAKIHLGNKIIFNTDIRNFYPSVHTSKIYQLFQHNLGCHPSIARILTKLTTKDYGLPAGTSTSPILANMVCYELDERLNNLATQYGLKYARFVDDITLSGDYIQDRVKYKVIKIIEQYGFRHHEGKTNILTKNENQIVTGICLNKNKLKVPRKYKRNLRAMKHSLALNQNDTPARTKLKSRIIGKETYVRHIESN